MTAGGVQLSGAGLLKNRHLSCRLTSSMLARGASRPSFSAAVSQKRLPNPRGLDASFESSRDWQRGAKHFCFCFDKAKLRQAFPTRATAQTSHATKPQDNSSTTKKRPTKKTLILAMKKCCDNRIRGQCFISMPCSH